MYFNEINTLDWYSVECEKVHVLVFYPLLNDLNRLMRAYKRPDKYLQVNSFILNSSKCIKLMHNLKVVSDCACPVTPCYTPRNSYSEIWHRRTPLITGYPCRQISVPVWSFAQTFSYCNYTTFIYGLNFFPIAKYI